jgi:O-antigen ligase
VEREIIEWQRWLFYLLVGPPIAVWIFMTRDSVLRLLALVAVVIFVQDTLAVRRSLLGISVGPSLIILSLVLAAYLFERGRLPAFAGYGLLWVGFLFSAFVGLVNGSVGTGLVFFNIREFQLIYLEGFLVFLAGYMAFRTDEEIDRFFRYMVFVAIGVASAHLFAVATGYRFRTGTDLDDLYYGALFKTPNNLASFYIIAIPIHLRMALQGRLSGFLRLSIVASLALMGASLFLTGSRGGMLCTVVMSLVAIFWRRRGTGRTLLAVAVGGFTLVLVYWFISTFFPAVGEETLRALETERFRSTRPQTWGVFLGIVLDHPFGVGLPPENITPVVRSYGHYIENAHNIYLNIGVSTGIPGVTFFVAIVALLLWRLFRALSLAATETQQRTLVYLILAVTAFLLAGVVEPIYTLAPKLNQFFWIICGIAAAGSIRLLAGSRVGGDKAVFEPPFFASESRSSEARDEVAPERIR